MIITKIDKTLVTVVIIINGNKLHSLETNSKNIAQVLNCIYNEKVSYIFEIINPWEVSRISLFEPIQIDD